MRDLRGRPPRVNGPEMADRFGRSKQVSDGAKLSLATGQVLGLRLRNQLRCLLDQAIGVTHAFHVGVGWREGS